MKSSSGKYYVRLDHVRAAAALLVFTWHFIHVNGGQFEPPPIYPLSLFTEGHTGVSLFMTLSGYLFAKLLNDKQIHYPSFIWNRVLRLVPLLLVVVLVVGYRQYLAGHDLATFSKKILLGLIKPTLPNGGWSITVEFHFYLLLPLLLFIARQSRHALLIVVIFAVLFRCLLYYQLGEMQKLSYWTIVGRIDQFLFGIIAFQFREYFANKHLLAISGILLFALCFWYFDSLGGYYNNPSYPSPSAIWIIMPTMEGMAYALLIAWYDNSFSDSSSKISRFFALIGTYSYSIYLLHFFVVFRLSRAVQDYVIELSNIYVAIVFAVLCFPLMIPVGYLSYRFIESPFLRLRKRYILPSTCQGESIDAMYKKKAA